MLKFSVISPDATYQLNTSVSSVNEGQSSTITLTTTGVQEGQTIPYTIGGVGITTDDISGEPLTGNFVVSGGVATKTLNIASDVTTEGQETLTMSLGNGTNVSLAINDTSLTPAAGDPYYDNVVLLMHMDGSILDTKGHVVKTEGVPAVSSSVTKFGTSSYACSATAGVYFDSNKDWDLSTGDFTVEFFIYPTSAPHISHIIGTANPWFGGGNSGGTGVIGGGGWGLAGYDNNITFVGNGNSQAVYPFTWTLNQWHHVAWVRKNGTYSLYQNGALKSASATGTLISDITNRLYIGRHTDYPSNNFPGYIDELRITKGVARYTSNFTIPEAAFPDVKNENIDPFWNNVVLRMPMDGADNGTTFTELTGKTVTRYGYTVTKTSVKLFGTASVYFDGSATGLLINNPNTEIGVITGDYTIECWVNWSTIPTGNSDGAEKQIIGQHNWPETAAGNWWVLCGVNTGLQYITAGGGSFGRIDGTFTWTQNTWYHVAVSRVGTTVRLFVNGALTGSGVSDKSIMVDNSRPLTIGCDTGADHNMMHGYIDDLRITKGAARYVTNFTPPARAFANMA